MDNKWKIEFKKNYKIIEGFDKKFKSNDIVTVIELRDSDYPHAYCYGVNGDSAYIHETNLQEI